jgi:hypothetical protein
MVLQTRRQKLGNTRLHSGGRGLRRGIFHCGGRIAGSLRRLGVHRFLIGGGEAKIKDQAQRMKRPRQKSPVRHPQIDGIGQDKELVAKPGTQAIAPLPRASFRARSRPAASLTDIRQIPLFSRPRIAFLTGSGKGESCPAPAQRRQSGELTAPGRWNASVCHHQGAPPLSSFVPSDPRTGHAGAGDARSRAISDRMSANIRRGTATSAIWNVT